MISGERNNEKKLRDFLFSLSTFIKSKRPKTVHEKCKCPFSKNGLICDKLTIEYGATMTGFFDFLLILRTSDLEMLEKFVLNCLKGNIGSALITDTQTLVGTYFFPDYKQLAETEEEYKRSSITYP
jgi:hypothetical protein